MHATDLLMNSQLVYQGESRRSATEVQFTVVLTFIRENGTEYDIGIDIFKPQNTEHLQAFACLFKNE